MGYYDRQKGRVKILSDLIPTGDVEQDIQIIPKIIDITLPQHKDNVNQIERLRNYYYNNTDVDKKTKVRQDNINNKIPIGYPSIAVTTINAYCFANPLTFSSRGENVEAKIKALNDALDDDSYAQKSLDMYLNSAITGLGYRYIVPASKEQVDNGVYFETVCDLKPEETYCVYSNDMNKEKICAINYQDKKLYDKNLKVIKTVTVYTVFTKTHKWEFFKSGGKWQNTTQYIVSGNGYEEMDAFPLPYNRIPIIENVRKTDRTGDFELALDLIDAINALASSRLDDVQQAVDYVIVLRDIDIWSDGALDRVKQAISEGILAFKSVEGAAVQPEVDVLNTKLNQAEVQKLQDFLCEKLEEVLNIPNRETRSSGGDTGSAVESRNGFRSLENIAGLVTSSALKTENESLDVILAICDNIDSCPFKGLKPKDVQIKDNRNRVENLTTSTNAYSTLRAAGMNDTDALIVSRIVPDPQSVAKKNKDEAEQEASQGTVSIETEQKIDATNNGSTSGNTVE